ncbi:hypothetical protein H6F90_25685 [Trichocoleus sp. FACHB-591]|uniref:hypothetical protein n=1 Tax=Trichocoleus TaxID=450526 RepID=UPI0016876B0A|nr:MULTISPECIES: hypothetical protein [unclassified Trichocoleus]MBD2098467.1 hypothetical protein [Trichocoleus sp. FACHB-591]MBD2123400.1 hypothetical protein [Trichocoleus sp. FACHB-262]
MEEKFSPTQKQEQLFRTELIKWGIEFEKAIKVARILALNIPNEKLSSSDTALVEEVCQEWFEKRKHWEQFKRVMAQHGANLNEVTLEDYQRANRRKENESSTRTTNQ